MNDWHRRFVLICALAAGLAYCAAAIAFEGQAPRDDDAPVDEGSTQPAKPAPKSAPESDPAEADTTEGDEADEKIIRRLEPALSDQVSRAIERLESAIAGMRQAGDQIGGSETGQATQKIQKKVISDLEELLALLKSQQQQQQNSQSQQQQQQQQQQKNQRQSLNNQKLDPQNSKQPSNGAPKPEPGDPQGERSDQARNSQERQDAARILEAEQARRRQIVKDVWGHLPPNVRQALEKTFSDKYLPRYEELLKRYYEALAEKNRDRTEPR